MRPLAQGELDEIVETTRSSWEQMRGGRLLLTGGTGFFGRWLVESFVHANARLRLGARVVVLSRRARSLATEAAHVAGDPAVTLHDGDVCVDLKLAGAFSHVVHAATAASASLNEESPDVFATTIVSGTCHALAAARASGARRFLLASSGAVYGRQPPGLALVGEEYGGGPDPMRRENAYAEAKRMAELYGAIACSPETFDVVVARGFAFVGPHLPLDLHFAIGNFIGDGLAKRPIRVRGDGTTLRSYLYASDLAIWLWSLLFEGRAGRAYNVGSEVAVSIGELAKRVGGRFGVPVEILGRAEPGRSAERYVPSTRRAREELGLAERVGLEEAIERTARWHEAGVRRSAG